MNIQPDNKDEILESHEENKIVYFRDRAKELGCKNVEELGDLAVWEYIIANQ
jgi:hypothetical protein